MAGHLALADSAMDADPNFSPKEGMTSVKKIIDVGLS